VYTDRLARGPWGAGITWQARRPNYGGLRRCARRGALASQSSTPMARAIGIHFAVVLILKDSRICAPGGRAYSAIFKD